MKRLPLHRPDGSVRAYALLDDEDLTRLAHFRWHMTSRGYVRRARPDSQSLHRAVMGLKAGDPQEVDHRNGDKLDNRRQNLRIIDRAGNQANQHGPHRRPGRTSRYRGVSLDRRDGRWLAYATINRRMFQLGRFDDEEDAARAAAAFRRERMPTSEMDQVGAR